MTWLNEISVSSKMRLLSAGVALGFAVLGFIAFSTLRATAVNGPAYDDVVRSKDIVADILPPPEYLIEAREALLAMSVTDDQAEKQRHAARFHRVRGEFEERHAYWLKQPLEATSAKLLLEDVYEPGTRFLIAAEQRYVPHILAGRTSAARAAWVTDLAAPYEEHRSAVDRLVLHEAEQSKRIEARVAALISSRSILLVGSSVALIVAAFLFSMLIARTIVKPLARMTEVAARLAEGDVDQEIEHRSADELGSLADSFRALVAYFHEVAAAADALSRGDVTVDVKPRSSTDVLSTRVMDAQSSLRRMMSATSCLIRAAQEGNLARRTDASAYQGGYATLVSEMNQLLATVATPLSETRRLLERIAAGDLTARSSGKFQGEFARTMDALDATAANLAESLGQVAVASTHVAAASAMVASSSQGAAQSASEQASALEQTSAALLDVSGATKRNADSASRANQLAESAEAASGSGRDAMSRLRDAMEKIHASARGTSEIIRDINDIAFQTNLLALNAAVEAARAGESGRGFAVVAEEVRNLALRSKEAARKTEALISESMSLSDDGQHISQQMNETLTGIVGGVSEVASLVAEIKRASEAQAHAIEQVNRAMSQMDSSTQIAAASAEESSNAAEELSSQAGELAALVAKFEIAGEPSPKRTHAAPLPNLTPAPRARVAQVEATLAC